MKIVHQLLGKNKSRRYVTLERSVDKSAFAKYAGVINFCWLYVHRYPSCVKICVNVFFRFWIIDDMYQNFQSEVRSLRLYHVCCDMSSFLMG